MKVSGTDWDKLYRCWHNRGFLPHFDMPGVIQMVTYRLADSLSPTRLAELRARYSPAQREQYLDEVDAELDAGYGACWLRDERVAKVIVDNWRHFDGIRYQLLAWVIMPNHVHVIIVVNHGWTLSQIVQGWKSYTAKEANKLLGRTGQFWQEDYFDRAVRNEEHLHRAVGYIHFNPVKAGLCQRMEDWYWSSYHELMGLVS